MNPPKVYEVTMPSNQRMIKITAMVYSMTKPLFKICNQFMLVYDPYPVPEYSLKLNTISG
ncbi:hypothetical protein [Sulfuriferula multivorans]|nr:hypothetical protein [Sulfuriferula multivorans]